MIATLAGAEIGRYELDDVDPFDLLEAQLVLA
jgi:hypothetical protein